VIAVSTGGGMMDVIELDGVPLRMNGGYAETLIWLGTAQRPAAERLAERLDADEILVHDTAYGLLVQVQAHAFVPEDALADLRPTRVKRLGRVLPVPSRSGFGENEIVALGRPLLALQSWTIDAWGRAFWLPYAALIAVVLVLLTTLQSSVLLPLFNRPTPLPAAART